MNTIYVDFDDIVSDKEALCVLNKYKDVFKIVAFSNEKEKMAEVSEGILIQKCDYKKISKKSFQISSNYSHLKTHVLARILIGWSEKSVGDDVIIVENWKEIDDFLEFYSKYDYKTLK